MNEKRKRGKVMNKSRLESIVNEVIQASLAADRRTVMKFVDPQIKDYTLIDDEIIKRIQRVLSEPDSSYQLSFEESYPFVRALIMTGSKQPLTPVPLEWQVIGLDIIYDQTADKYYITLK